MNGVKQREVQKHIAESTYLTVVPIADIYTTVHM